jgi:hypothetical protein
MLPKWGCMNSMPKHSRLFAVRFDQTLPQDQVKVEVYSVLHGNVDNVAHMILMHQQE